MTEEVTQDQPLFRWMLIHPHGVQTFFKMQMDKNTAIELMKGLYAQVNNGNLTHVEWEVEMQNFLNLYRPIKPLQGLDDNTKKS